MIITLEDLISWNQNDSTINGAMMGISEAALTKDTIKFIAAVDDAQRLIIQALKSNTALREDIRNR
jgi:hypothetical protein